MSAPPTGTVTFLFTDIEGSTRRWEEQPDAMQRALQRHDAILRDAIERHGGYVFKTMGDAFYAAFARATNAVMAAVAAQRALASKSWGEASPGRVRMALHTGAADERDGDYFGPPLNRVARLHEAGHGGQVLLSGVTADLVRDRLPEGVQLRDLGEHRLRDLARPEHVYQLAIWRLPADFPPLRIARDLRTTPPTPATSFVGRAAELAGLRTALDASTVGQGRLVLVSGEPGIGKTRLAQELSTEAQAGGCLVLWGRCWEGEGAPAFWPWVEALGAYARSLDPQTLRTRLGDAASDLAQLVPDIKSALPDVPAPASAEPEQARFRLFGGVSTVLTGIATTRPLVLVLDDLHWADKPSLLLLQFLVRQLGSARLLVLGTYRDTDLDRQHPLAEALTSLRREPVVERLSLRGLSKDEVVTFMETRAGHALDAHGRTLAEALHRETEGNPLFVSETLRHLADTGGIAQEDGRWRVTTKSVADLGIPEGVREVIGRRLSRLTDTCNALLTVGAVLGREFDADVLERVSDASASGVDAALEEAAAAGVVAEVRGGFGRYRFSHALVRETLLHELSTRRRVRLHHQVGEALETYYGARVDQHAAELAYHFVEAAVTGAEAATKAIRYAVQAGEAARRAFAWEEAARHWRAALEVMDEQGDEVDLAERARLLERLTDLTWVGADADWQRSVGYAEEALRLYEQLGDTYRVALMHSRLGRLYDTQDPLTTDIHRAFAHFRQAEELLRQGPERLALGYVYVSMASAGWMAMPVTESLAAARQAMAISERLGNKALWANAAMLEGALLWDSGRIDEGLALLERVWEIADRQEFVFVARITSTWLAVYSLYVGDPQHGLPWLQQELGKVRQSARVREQLSESLAVLQTEMGQTPAASPSVDETTDRRLDWMWVRWLVRRGEWEMLETRLHEAVEITRRTVNRAFLAMYCQQLATLYLQRGEADRAEPYLSEALGICSEMGHAVLEMHARLTTVLVAAAMGRLDVAQANVQRCQELLTNGADWRGLAGRVALAEGVLFGAQAHLDEAAMRFGEAVGIFQRYALPWDEAEAHGAWGRAHLAGGDAETALEHFDAALALYARIDAPQRWREQVLAERARAAQGVRT